MPAYTSENLIGLVNAIQWCAYMKKTKSNTEKLRMFKLKSSTRMLAKQKLVYSLLSKILKQMLGLTMLGF